MVEAVNVQTARLWLARKIVELDGTWNFTLRTIPELKATYTVQIGHAPPSADSFASSKVELPVAWWVNEAGLRAAVGKLYGDLSYAPNSLVQRLRAEPGIKGIDINSIGAQLEGPTGFLRAVSTFRLQLSLVPEEELPDNDDDEES